MDSLRQSYQNLLIETQIFPPIMSVAFCIQAESLKIEAQENYQKRSFRNRYHIGSHQGLLELSVPLLKGKNKQQPITDVKIAYNSPWPNNHWKAIQSSYGKSAFFIYYEDLIKELLFSECTHLFELNLKSWMIIQKILQKDLNIQLTKEFIFQYSDDICDLRSKINPKSINTFSIPEYYQVYSKSSGFIPHLSILDLVFHLGPEAILYLIEINRESV